MVKAEKKIGLALGSGGAKGLAHIEFLKVFDELGIRPSMIAGASMGALIGSLYASGMRASEIEEIYKRMTRAEMARLLDVVLYQRKGVLKGDKILAWLRKRLRCRRFSELKIPLKVVATDFWKREQVVLDKGDIAKAVRASISLPGIFIPVLHRRRVLVDGGLVNPVPYDLLAPYCDVVVAVDVFGRDSRSASRIPSIIENLMHSVYIMYNTIEKAKTAKPDLRLSVSLNDIKTLDFHKYRQVKKGARGSAAKLRRFLREQVR